MTNNPFVLTDAYKTTHFEQYPEAQEMCAYGEFRKPMYDHDHRIVWFGIDYILKNTVGRQLTQEDLDNACPFFDAFGIAAQAYPFPKDLMQKIIDEHNGWMPLEIRTLPEGAVIMPRTPVYTIRAKGEFARLITWFETIFTQVWFPAGVATISAHVKETLRQAYERSVDPGEHWTLDSRFHDFGFRGTSSIESAALGGAAHLLSFDGTDTLVAAAYAHTRANYPFANSIPATEHSVMMSWPTELQAVEHMIDLYGHTVFATVADTYDYHNFLNNILPLVADKVKAKSGVHIVRPDSGDPVETVLLGLEGCARAYGYTTNAKGYKVLNNSGVIQGDGIGPQDIQKIIQAVMAKGFSAQNVAFGMGGGLLQKHNRDTMSFATKLCYIRYADGTERNLMKRPKTDVNKMSLPGKMIVQYEDGVRKVFPYTWSNCAYDELRLVYDGKGVLESGDSWELIRLRLQEEWKNTHNPTANPFSVPMQKLIADTWQQLNEEGR